MGAVTMEAGIRVVVGVGRWNSAICHCWNVTAHAEEIGWRGDGMCACFYVPDFLFQVCKVIVSLNTRDQPQGSSKGEHHDFWYSSDEAWAGHFLFCPEGQDRVGRLEKHTHTHTHSHTLPFIMTMYGCDHVLHVRPSLLNKQEVSVTTKALYVAPSSLCLHSWHTSHRT